MVGHLGVEPSDTALSGRPLRPAGSWPRKTEVSIPAAFRPPRVFKTRCRAGGASSKEESGRGERQEESGGPDPQRSPAHPFSGRGLPPGRFTLHGVQFRRLGCELQPAEPEENGGDDPHGLRPPPAFQTGTTTR